MFKEPLFCTSLIIALICCFLLLVGFWWGEMGGGGWHAEVGVISLPLTCLAVSRRCRIMFYRDFIISYVQ